MKISLKKTNQNEKFLQIDRVIIKTCQDTR